MFWKILIVALILLLLFGSHRLGAIGQNLGLGIRNFKKGLNGDDPEPEPEPEPEPKEPKLLPPKQEQEAADPAAARADEGDPERKG